jgi:septal ring factor EnvC (AmiA/AmiB activator)
LREELAKARRLKADALAATAGLKASRLRLADMREALGRLEAEKRVTARGFSSGASLEAERATALGEQARDIGDLMNELQVAGDVRQRLARLPVPPLRRTVAAPGALPPSDAPERSSADPAYRLPVVGSIVTGFGELSDSGIRSRGLTVATEPGAQVVAPARGRVVFAGPYKGFGQIVILDHGDGWSSLIADLGRLTVSSGRSVTAGSPIGVARTGASPTVIVELRRQGRPVDILAMAGAGL